MRMPISSRTSEYNNLRLVLIGKYLGPKANIDSSSLRKFSQLFAKITNECDLEMPQSAISEVHAFGLLFGGSMNWVGKVHYTL